MRIGRAVAINRLVVAQPFSMAIYLFEPSDGGLDRVAILLANALFERGHDVSLWMTRTEGPLRDLINRDIPIMRVPALDVRRSLAMALQLPALRAMVRKLRPTLLYSAGNQSNGLIALAAWGLPTRAVGRISNPIVRPGRGGPFAWLRKARFRFQSKISAMTIVMGAADRDILENPGLLTGRNVAVLPRPTITPAIERAALTRRPRTAGEPWRFLIVGRLSPQKDQQLAIAALGALSDVNWTLDVIGQGPLRDSLERQCEALGISERVTFHGFIGDPEPLATLMADSDILLFPSQWEGFGGVIAEALGTGMSVVATNSTPNLCEMLSAASQHTPTPIGDVAAFESAIRWTMANLAHPEHARRAVRSHTVDAAIDAHEAAFQRAAAEEIAP